jgi:hypothetical protein
VLGKMVRAEGSMVMSVNAGGLGLWLSGMSFVLLI